MSSASPDRLPGSLAAGLNLITQFNCTINSGAAQTEITIYCHFNSSAPTGSSKCQDLIRDYRIAPNPSTEALTLRRAIHKNFIKTYIKK